MKNRDAFTESLGDLLFVIPAIRAANAHRGSLFTSVKNAFPIPYIIFNVMHFQQHRHLHISCPRIDAGAPVYLYQYHHPPSFLRDKRPSFVGSDHGDEVLTVLGFCFTTSHIPLTGKGNIKSLFQWTIRDPHFLWVSSCRGRYFIVFFTVLGTCTEEDERLSKIMMNYWGNFARTG